MRHLIILWDEDLNVSAAGHKKSGGNKIIQKVSQKVVRENNFLSRIKVVIPIQLGLNLGVNAAVSVPGNSGGGPATPFIAVQGLAAARQRATQDIDLSGS